MFESTLCVHFLQFKIDIIYVYQLTIQHYFTIIAVKNVLRSISCYYIIIGNYYNILIMEIH